MPACNGKQPAAKRMALAAQAQRLDSAHRHHKQAAAPCLRQVANQAKPPGQWLVSDFANRLAWDCQALVCMQPFGRTSGWAVQRFPTLKAVF